jgi:hypothetical protein
MTDNALKKLVANLSDYKKGFRYKSSSPPLYFLGLLKFTPYYL